MMQTLLREKYYERQYHRENKTNWLWHPLEELNSVSLDYMLEKLEEWHGVEHHARAQYASYGCLRGELVICRPALPSVFDSLSDGLQYVHSQFVLQHRLLLIHQYVTSPMLALSPAVIIRPLDQC
jgi:hypothetical protein